MSKTLQECMPELNNGEFDNTRAYTFRNIEVTAEHGNHIRWIGKEKNVQHWVDLKNGYAVGFNENPNRGYSFPTVKVK